VLPIDRPRPREEPRLTDAQVLGLAQFGFCRDADCPIRNDDSDGDPYIGPSCPRCNQAAVQLEDMVLGWLVEARAEAAASGVASGAGQVERSRTNGDREDEQ
jgi:hypothetical protein